MGIYERLFPDDAKTRVWVLVDPDGTSLKNTLDNISTAEEEGISAILAGGSFVAGYNFDEFIKSIREATNLPVILFPGSSRQLSAHADGILFTSLLSGRNPQYLIGEQVMAAPAVFQMKLESIPTAYLMIESGRTTSAQFVSDTHPIPNDKPQIAVAHAMAAVLLGMKAVYLEAGSGAEIPVPCEVVKAVAKSVSIPVITGGGITRPEHAVAIAGAGCRAIVVGTAVERRGGSFIRELMSALGEVVK